MSVIHEMRQLLNENKFTVLVTNDALKTSRYVGEFDSSQDAEEYARREATRSRKFAEFEVWTGTPKKPGKPTTARFRGEQ